jgi:hypothetical protein
MSIEGTKMQALSDGVLLGIWERGRVCGPIERALIMLSAARPDIGAEGCADLDVGARDAEILQLRQAIFGPRLQGCVRCPACGQRLEFELDATRLAPDAPGDREFTLDNDLRFRLPSSRDLAAVADLPNVEATAHRLLQLCCLNAPDGQEWPQALLHDAEARMASLQHAADIELTFTCDACGHPWADHFDICTYFWDELEQRVERLLDDVHRLAWCYGWDEQHILAMSDARRAAYLTRCDA